MPVGRAIAKGLGGFAALIGGAAVMLLALWGFGFFRPAPPVSASAPEPAHVYNELEEIPDATVADIAALPLTSRTEFMRGYISALAAIDSEWASCTRVWYFLNGGNDQLEYMLTHLDKEPNAAGKRAAPMGEYLQANLKFICRKL